MGRTLKHPEPEERWTVERVKEELPTIPVLTVVAGDARGRQNKFATVHLPDGRQYEVAWSTLAHALNTKSPIRAGHDR